MYKNDFIFFKILLVEKNYHSVLPITKYLRLGSHTGLEFEYYSSIQSVGFSIFKTFSSVSKWSPMRLYTYSRMGVSCKDSCQRIRKLRRDRNVLVKNSFIEIIMWQLTLSHHNMQLLIFGFTCLIFDSLFNPFGPIFSTHLWKVFPNKGKKKWKGNLSNKFAKIRVAYLKKVVVKKGKKIFRFSHENYSTVSINKNK